MEEKRCGNCGNEMRFLKRENVQLGKTGLFLGDWPHLFAGAQDLEFWVCPKCRKLEFYIPEDAMSADSDVEQAVWEQSGANRMAQVVCETCGTKHNLDDPKCPACGAKNRNL